MSSLMARTSFRRFSACLAWSDCISIRESLVTPSTRRPISTPNILSMSSCVAGVSSMVSCSSAVMIDAQSSRYLVKIPATSMGWEK